MQQNDKKFWNKFAKIYPKLLYSTKSVREAYATVVCGVQKELNQQMNVLELAAGPGNISKKIAPYCNHLTATDFSEKMIEQAAKNNADPKIHYQVADATALSFAANSFDAVVIVNGLHVMPHPEKALQNVRSVLTKNGLLIAPTLVRGTQKESLLEKFVALLGLRIYSKWTQTSFQDFIVSNGFDLLKSHIIKGHIFPLAFVVARVKK